MEGAWIGRKEDEGDDVEEGLRRSRFNVMMQEGGQDIAEWWTHHTKVL